MKANIIWKDQVKDKEGKPICIYDIAFHPDGDQLVLATGHAIQVYDAMDGKMLNKLNAHKDNVHSLSYSRDGEFFASGSADKSVIIWTSQLEGHLKYSHGDGIQCIAYNPVSHRILSCAISDIGLWSPEHRNVAKRKVSSRVCSCSWTNDGQYFALGLFNGLVTIWTKNGDEKIKIERPGGHPVWCLAWNPSRGDHYDILSVCDWGQRLSFFQLSGRQIGKDHPLGFDPCFLSHSADGDFFLIGGSNKAVCLFSKDGIKLGTIGESHNSWVWSCLSRPGGKYLVVTYNDGTVVCYHVTMGTIHGLYKDRYAFREGLTDVIVQHLLTQEKVRLKCRDLVKKIAVYKNRLAVQLPDKIIIYESSTDDDSGDMTYVVKERLARDVQCSLLVCCSESIVFCMERKLQCLSMKGEIEREWEVESQIRYLKVIGGPPGKEALLAGLKNGQVLKVFLDNPFPLQLLKISGVVRCVDLSLSHMKLAIVDEGNVLMVYDLRKKEMLYQEPNATSVAWNNCFEEMLCFSGLGVLHIKASNFTSQQQRLQTGQGFVVGFVGSKIFSLHYFTMTATDVPLSAPMIQYLEQKQYENAYKIACLGVTQSDWRTLALEALEGLNFEVAKKGFVRIRDFKFLELIHVFEEQISQGENGLQHFLGDIYANEGKFQEAAKAFRKAGDKSKAVEMFMDLCQFELAKQILGEPATESGKPKEVELLITKQADWAKTKNDPEKACKMYLSAGKYTKAISLMAENGWTHQLIDLARSLEENQREALKLCAYELQKMGEYNFAADVYEKLKDYQSLAILYATTKQWEKGFDLVDSQPDLKDLLYLPYVTYLMENDKFEEAQEALTKGGKQNEAVSLLAQLTETALCLNKYQDASYYHWLQARAYLTEAERASDGNKDITSFVEKFHLHIKKAEIYYAYQYIHSFINLPFTGQLPETLFNVASFLTLHMMMETPSGVSAVSTLVTLAKYGMMVGAYKTARYAFEQLQSLVIPTDLQDFVDNATLTLKGKVLQDKEELLRFCYRCSTTNPLISSCGHCCETCGETFIYSLVSFDVLPVVQFFLEDDISDDEAMRLIKSEPQSKKTSDWTETTTDNIDILHLDHGPNNSDPFITRMLMTDDQGRFSQIYVDRTMLSNMHWREVIVKRWPYPLKFQYYRSLLADVHIQLCSSCNQMFFADDYQVQVLCKGQCPFCRQQPITTEQII